MPTESRILRTKYKLLDPIGCPAVVSYSAVFGGGATNCIVGGYLVHVLVNSRMVLEIVCKSRLLREGGIFGFLLLSCPSNQLALACICGADRCGCAAP
jgi:hypothetical protein